MRIVHTPIAWARKFDDNLIRGMICGGFSRETLIPTVKAYPPAHPPKKMVFDIPKMIDPTTPKCKPRHPRSVYSSTRLPGRVPPLFFEQILPQGILN